MSSRTTPRPRHEAADADPWWSDPQPTLDDPAAGATALSRRRGTAPRTGIGWTIARLLAAPLRLAGGYARRSERLRRVGLRLAITLVVVGFLACSVGVILINNVVIGRTAELGKLEDSRRELRRDNALLGAQAAQLSAPPVVVRRAERDLGMVRSPDLPQFIFLDPGSRTLTPLQRRRVASRPARQRALAAAREAAAAAKTREPRP